jgi:cephalosporin hydroxylase
MTEEEYWNLRNTCAHVSYDGHEREPFGWWLLTQAYDFWDLIDKLNEIQPKIILEIGTNHGGSAVFFDHIAGPQGQVITIDHPLLPEHHPCSVLDKRYSPYVPISDLAHFLGDSHQPETLERIKGLLKGPVDFLYIDGDHDYKGAKLDYEMYGPLVRKGGIIGMDDIISMPDHVGRAWEEIPLEKVVLQNHKESRGIGVAYV